MKTLNSNIARIAVVMAALGAVSVPVAAQTPQGADNARPFSVTAATFAGYDTDITATTTGRASGRGTGASHAGASLSTAYSGGSPRLNYYMVGSSEFRYYRADEGLSQPLTSGRAGIGKSLGRRVHVDASLQAAYFPRFQFSVLPLTTDIPVDIPGPTLDYSISSYDVVSTQAAVNAAFQLDSRSSIRVNYGRGQFRYLGRDYQLDSDTGGIGYSRNLTRYATLQLGYSDQAGHYVTDEGISRSTVRRRTIDAGINYSRPLSLSRRTTVGFSTGSTALDNGNGTFYTLTGGANLNHQLARRWNLSIAYSRRVGLVGGFAEPIFADSVFVNLSGSLADRVIIGLSSGYANGRVGLESRERNYDSLQSTARVDVPISRRMFLFGNYFHYQYMFNEQVLLPAGLTPHVNRHGVRAGLGFKIF